MSLKDTGIKIPILEKEDLLSLESKNASTSTISKMLLMSDPLKKVLMFQ